MAEKQRGTKEPARTKYGAASVSSSNSSISWAAVSGALCHDAICAVTEAGDAILFAKTSDGGALSLRVLCDGLVEKWWPSGVVEAESVLEGIKDSA